MPNNSLVAFGRKVRKFRKDAELSQEELADLAGVHRTYIGMVERAEKNVALKNIAKIAAALGKPIREFF